MEGNIQDDRYRVVDSIIYYKHMIYFVPKSIRKDRILREKHDAPLAGHQEYLKTYMQVRERFTWKGLKEDVLCHVRDSMNFQQNKLDFTHHVGMLHSLSILELKWDSISTDFIIGFPKV